MQIAFYAQFNALSPTILRVRFFSKVMRSIRSTIPVGKAKGDAEQRQRSRLAQTLLSNLSVALGKATDFLPRGNRFINL